MLSDLRRKGASLALVGRKLRVHAPPGVLTSDVQAELRSNQEAIAVVLCTERDATRSLGDEVDREWAAAVKRASNGFCAHDREPSRADLEGTAMLERWIADGGLPRRGLSIGDLQGWLEEIYAGRASGRLLDDGRGVLRPRYNPADVAVRPLEVEP